MGISEYDGEMPKTQSEYNNLMNLLISEKQVLKDHAKKQGRAVARAGKDYNIDIESEMLNQSGVIWEDGNISITRWVSNHSAAKKIREISISGATVLPKAIVTIVVIDLFDEYSTPLYTAQSLLINSRELKKLNLYDLYD